MAIPGSLTSLLPAGPDEIPRRLRDIERQATEDRASIARSFAPVIADLTAKQVTLDATVATLATTVSGLATAQATLATTVTNLGTAQADIAAQLVSINALIGSQVTVSQASVTQFNYATATTAQDFAVGSIAVPAGFSQALVFVTAMANVVNSSASADYLLVSAGINATSSREMGSGLAVGGANAGASSAKSSLLTGLSGGTITVRTIIHTQGSAWAANASNRAYTEAIAVFLR